MHSFRAGAATAIGSNFVSTTELQTGSKVKSFTCTYLTTVLLENSAQHSIHYKC